jgi:S-adenosylmethionine:tRNA ribosyltransferase-isomerase
MSTSIDQFDYILPPERIAQFPAEPRESGKLMILDRKTHAINHSYISGLPLLFKSGDVLVINNTKVFRARLKGVIDDKSVELFLVRPTSKTSWLALGKPGKKIIPGKSITVAPDFIAKVIQKNSDGTLVVDFGLTAGDTIAKANTYGSVPIPPYIKIIPDDAKYQTSFAKEVGSVAAPTAGFHFTPTILSTLKQKGVTILEITLHVGLGTFLPIKSETIEEHAIHSEWVNLPPDVALTITQAKQEGRRIIAVGTTTVRTLEGVADTLGGTLAAYQGDINLFITPGFKFKIIDGMVTNFHLPKSSLVVLVSSFAGREYILSAYEEAIKKEYRFYSFGDAMFIA